MKMNNEQAAAEWEDYKEFLEGMGQFGALQNMAIKKEIERAFKIAFVKGLEASKALSEQEPQNMTISAETISSGLNMDIPAAVERVRKEMEQSREAEQLELLPFEVKEKRSLNFRGEDQIMRQSKAVRAILQHAKRPMRLADITDEMNRRGFKWAENGASSYMKIAGQRIKGIKKVGYGKYAYIE